MYIYLFGICSTLVGGAVGEGMIYFPLAYVVEKLLCFFKIPAFIQVNYANKGSHKQSLVQLQI